MPHFIWTAIFSMAADNELANIMQLAPEVSLSFLLCNQYPLNRLNWWQDEHSALNNPHIYDECDYLFVIGLKLKNVS